MNHYYFIIAGYPFCINVGFPKGFSNLFFQLTVLWKVVGKILSPKPKKAATEENKPVSSELKWSFAAGTNLLKNMSQKIERDSKLRLNDFAKELRTFREVDMTGTFRNDIFLGFLCDSSFIFKFQDWFSVSFIWFIIVFMFL